MLKIELQVLMYQVGYECLTRENPAQGKSL